MIVVIVCIVLVDFEYGVRVIVYVLFGRSFVVEFSDGVN